MSLIRVQIFFLWELRETWSFKAEKGSVQLLMRDRGYLSINRKEMKVKKIKDRRQEVFKGNFRWVVKTTRVAKIPQFQEREKDLYMLKRVYKELHLKNYCLKIQIQEYQLSIILIVRLASNLNRIITKIINQQLHIWLKEHKIVQCWNSA